jgi:fumarate reductase subunit C
MDKVTPTKELIRSMPATWWLKRRVYFLYMVRELTCVFVGGYAVFMLFLVMRLDDASAFAALLDSKALVALQILALPMILYHSITWFNLTPKVMVVWRGEERVSPILIAGANYLAWIAVSVVIVWIASLYR